MINMNGTQILMGWDEALKSDDPRDANRYLWQHCQDFIQVIRQQKFVIELLNDVIDDKDEQIEQLNLELNMDRYGD